MYKILFILILFGCQKKEMSLIKVISVISKGTGAGELPSGPSLRLIVFTGESNSGGVAVNADATGPELSARASLKIWNNTSDVFQDLDIGTNNLISHAGLADNATHGWELELANLAAAETIPNPTYLVKAGQGGSVLTDWGTGGAYYTTLKSRIDSALAAQSFIGIVFFYTHGINDRIAGTATGTFKTRIQTHIANIKADYPGAKFVMCKNMTNNGNDIYNTVLQEIDDADADFVTVSVTGAGVQGDGNHWTYGGMKQICDSMVTSMLVNGW